MEDVSPWESCIEEIKDDVCISISDFEKWRERLLKILGGAK